MGAKYASATGRAERVGKGVRPSILLIPNSQLTHLVTDAPGTRTEPSAARALRAMATQLCVHGRAPAADRQRVNFHAGVGAGHGVVYTA